MKSPYHGIPSYQNWKRSVAIAKSDNLDPVTKVKFRIDRSHSIATAGSCFAQHISRNLASNGFNYLITEAVPEAFHILVDSDELTRYNYGTFTARYGNIYTARQLLQLHKRAYGDACPEEQFWQVGPAKFIDPFRPAIQPNGFMCEAELVLDRAKHLAATRSAFETMDILIFTLGLTETFLSRDGFAYPVAPGVVGGTYDSSVHAFANFGVDDVIKDLTDFWIRVKQRNPSVRMILTVSPVPLMATAVDRHVLVSNTVSKSVLRLAADQLDRNNEDIQYFPSYEIITSQTSRGNYYGDDFRTVLDSGVKHVMKVFSNHYIDKRSNDPDPIPKAKTAAFESIAAAAEVACDEELLSEL